MASIVSSKYMCEECEKKFNIKTKDTYTIEFCPFCGNQSISLDDIIEYDDSGDEIEDLDE